ncbi:F-box domain protein [Cordyceps fumosorosea ARSEF 2679]|uniref:F-box domain protein n=1 Tax=Cordyceps fumosorosea (strain ARSEF 2679) TaxID=1081104 RepID=A0A162MDZ0_CORFA|nr:F-box domain protein [Cordyceps fumosorosea ARSEF 2679]OAA54860.1 F-box domain protein [Cordyceps fumosorosea ARSEF 2679]
MALTLQDPATQLAASPVAQSLIQELFQSAADAQHAPNVAQTPKEIQEAFEVGVAALNIFLQINVTGPVPSRQPIADIEALFLKAWASTSHVTTSSDSAVTPITKMRRDCVRQLEIDGVSPYSHIPSLELFCLARRILTKTLATSAHDVVQLPGPEPQKHSISWTRLRVHVWHYKLIAQPSLGGSTFTKSSNWIELPSLATQITDSMDAVRRFVLNDDVWADQDTWSTQEKVQFLLEAANNNILLGRADKAKELVQEASKTSNFLYALSGALGKRTKFQEKSISQLVVLALSQAQETATEAGEDEEDDFKPQALQLNDDTLLEEIQFSKERNGRDEKSTELPEKLANLVPDEQPQLSPLDQITLLTEATIKDTFSPADTLTAEEILPFATRVLADKSTNWQTYTQALLVRSRIEVHRSRTLERGVLQMQAVADQVLTDTTFSNEGSVEPGKQEEKDSTSAPEVPSIQVSAPGHHTGDEAASATGAPTSFFPAPKASESAPADVRLRYIHALSTPPRWHLEAELAYAWAGAGSIVSALEIFKRLRLWAEVALCLAAADAMDDEDGRGSGGEAKAKGIVRWQLFNKTGADATSSSDPDDEVAVQEVASLKADDFAGPERSLAPSNAPRLWCILGDLEGNAAFYERAWEVSGHRYARAQRSLAEHYLREKDLKRAHTAYKKATTVNRLDPDMWSRLGDISLRLGRFEDAAVAFNRAIGSATGDLGGEDAKTWSNLGTALWSLYSEVIAAQKEGKSEAAAVTEVQAKPEDDEDETVAVAAAAAAANKTAQDTELSKDPQRLLAQALHAYKMGATAAHDNWRIWENVVTLACRMRPPAVADILAATRQILRIRPTEDAVNATVLGALLQEEVLSKPKDAAAEGVYEPARGTTERLVTRVIEEDIVPLITRRAELWSLVGKLRAWRRDYAGAIDAAEKAWRAAVGSSGSGLLPGSSDAAASSTDWTEDEAAWLDVVARTDELVVALETWGDGVEEVGARWRGKARSAVRSVMGRGKTAWEGSEGWTLLEALMEGLKVNK